MFRSPRSESQQKASKSEKCHRDSLPRKLAILLLLPQPTLSTTQREGKEGREKNKGRPSLSQIYQEEKRRQWKNLMAARGGGGVPATEKMPPSPFFPPVRLSLWVLKCADSASPSCTPLLSTLFGSGKKRNFRRRDSL